MLQIKGPFGQQINFLKNVVNLCLMKNTVYFASITVVLAFALIYVSVANAQNVTTKASNAMGNASAMANQTAGKIMNKTGEAGQKIGGAMGNASEKIKEGIGAK